MTGHHVLVTGGAGYIGSHTCKLLAQSGFLPVTYDNLTRGNRWAVKWGPLEVGDILDERYIASVIEKYRPVAVMHFAALAYVGESVEKPDLYYRNNVSGSISLLKAMLKNKIMHLVFSSTCSTYGVPRHIPITENHDQDPVNPYGFSKLAVERILKDYGVAFGLKSISFRYFNAAGADPDAEIGEMHLPETHLIPQLLDVALGRSESICVYGNDYKTPDGTCIRDYVHVADIANAHVLALRYLLDGGKTNYCNLGTGEGYSVFEVIEAVERITGKIIPRKFVARRKGDPTELVAEAAKARDILRWVPERSSLAQQLEDAWQWHNSNSFCPSKKQCVAKQQ